MNRRTWLKAMAAAAGSSLLAPLSSLAAEVKAVRIKEIEIFPLVLPATPTEEKAGVLNRPVVTRVTTDSGVRGYAFGGGFGLRAAGKNPINPAILDPVPFGEVRKHLLGTDIFALETNLKRGLLYQGVIEEAIWDAIGRIAGQPIARLLGGAKTSIPVYITAVWQGPVDQSHVPLRDQAVYARKLKDAGFTGFKMRIFRANFMDDVESCAGIIDACGPAPGFKTMVDRTAHQPGTLWDYPTGLAAARELQKVGVYWLEEPFSRDDFDGPARLSREMDPLLITGGEGWRGLDAFREGLVHDTYDVFQPDQATCGGLLTMRKIAALCEAFHKPCIGHGAFGLNMVGRIQAHAAWGAPMQEMALATPPLLPQEQWAPALKILNQKELYVFHNGEIQVPQGPGNGLDYNEDAIEHYRTKST